MGRHRVLGRRIVLDEDAFLVAAVDVAGNEVELLTSLGREYGEVAHAGDGRRRADGVHDPKPRTSGRESLGSREAFGAQLDEDGVTFGRDGKRRPSRERAALTKAAPSTLIG